jgi:hypothetical protein
MKTIRVPLQTLLNAVRPVSQPRLTGLTSSPDGYDGLGQSPCRGAISIRAKPVRTRHQRYDTANAGAAQIILSDPTKYDGLPLEWARLWMSRHGAQRKKPVSASASPRRAGTEEVTHERIATS